MARAQQTRQTPEPDEVMTPREVANFLKLPLSTVYKLTQEGRLRGVKLGKHWRYLASDVRLQIAAPAPTASGLLAAEAAERRRHPRIDVRMPAQFRVEVPQVKQCTGKGAIANVSRGGLMLVIDELSVQGQLVRLDDPIQVELQAAPFGTTTLAGRIVRFAEGPQTTLGVELAPLPDELAGKWSAWVEGMVH